MTEDGTEWGRHQNTPTHPHAHGGSETRPHTLYLVVEAPANVLEVTVLEEDTRQLVDPCSQRAQRLAPDLHAHVAVPVLHDARVDVLDGLGQRRSPVARRVSLRLQGGHARGRGASAGLLRGQLLVCSGGLLVEAVDGVDQGGPEDQRAHGRRVAEGAQGGRGEGREPRDERSEHVVVVQRLGGKGVHQRGHGFAKVAPEGSEWRAGLEKRIFARVRVEALGERRARSLDVRQHLRYHALPAATGSHKEAQQVCSPRGRVAPVGSNGSGNGGAGVAVEQALEHGPRVRVHRRNLPHDAWLMSLVAAMRWEQACTWLWRGGR